MAFEIVPSERVLLALRATWELESIGNCLVDRTSGIEADRLVIRSLAVRVRTLSVAIMSALGDERFEIEKIREAVDGNGPVLV